MKEALKELIENAETKRGGEFDFIMCVPNGIYHGFWGENGFDNMLILGSIEGKWYKVADSQVDIFNIYHINYSNFNMDVPSDYEVPRFWFSGHKIKLSYEGLSDCSGELIKREDSECTRKK